MPDICDLILDDHETFRRRFGELDELRQREDRSGVGAVWDPLADLLELHASTEEELFYPKLLRRGDDAETETEDAIRDHNDIRQAVSRVASADVGTERWWDAVLAARATNSDHMAEEERGAIPDFRVHTPDDQREELGNRWLAFQAAHAQARGLDTSDKDPDRYLSRHR